MVLLVLGIAGGAFAYYNFFRAEPPPFFQSDEDHFLFGSIGTEDPEGIPYWIWLVLPRIFPEYLPAPGGYASVGFPGKDGHDMPAGFSKVTVGFERVGINCAACHAATYRARAGDPPTIVAAGASHQTSPQALLRFLFACANDPRFTADTILAEIAKNYKLSMTQRTLYRFAIIPGRCAAFAGCSRTTRGCRHGPTGAAAGSIRSIRSSSGISRSRSTRPSATRTCSRCGTWRSIRTRPITGTG